MVRLSTSVLAVSLLAVPALAASSEQYERSVAESDLYGRNLLDVEDTVEARELLDELFGRELVNDMEERSPFGLGLLFKGIKGIAKIAHKGHSAHEHVQNFQNNRHQQRREFDDEEFDLRDFDEDLEERDPFGLGLLFKGIKGIAKIAHKGHSAHEHVQNFQNNRQQQRREFDDKEFDLRDFDEDLEAREPGKFGAVFRVAKNLVHRHGHHAENLAQFIPQNNDQNQRREFDEELDARDFDEDLEAREPGKFGAIFRVAKGLVHKHGHHAQNLGQFIPQNNDQNQRREFDELDDILERDYFDELD